jgi:hypothetical protein
MAAYAASSLLLAMSLIAIQCSLSQGEREGGTVFLVGNSLRNSPEHKQCRHAIQVRVEVFR